MTTATASAAVVESLGTAWTVYSLYPEPEHQPAFRRAVEALRAAAADPVHLELDVNGFMSGGELVTVEREGADRLAKRCYLHQLEYLNVVAPPTESDVARLFASLAKEETEAMASGGVEAALRRDGVSSFTVVQRTRLATGAKDEPVDRDPTVQEVLDESIAPEDFARSLMDEAGNNPAQLAELVLDRYHETVDRIGGEDVAGREGVVQAFVEAFFFFDEPGQIAVFRRFLASDHAFDRVFLDQFAGHELARLAPRLDSQGLSLLLDYARVATDQADGRPQELLAILRNPEALQSMREVAAAKVQERLSSIDEAAAQGARFLEVVRHSFPSPQRYFYDALEVFRGLLAVETRDKRFERLMRIWAGKVSEAVRQRQFRRAELWLRAGTTKPTFPDERRMEVEAALGSMASPDVLSIVVEAAGDDDESATKILQALGPRAAHALLDLLAEEESAPRRRLLMRVLASVAETNPAPLIGRLGDERWYVVRNVLWALREAGVAVQPGAVLPALSHGDHRVRIEALRVLASAAPLDAVPHVERAMSDQSLEVRSVALGLLGSSPDSRAESALVAAANDRRLEVQERVTAIGALGDRNTPPAEAALGQMASRRFLLSSSARTIRDAARKALGA